MPFENIFIIGAGRIGSGLALALLETSHHVVGIWNRSYKKELEKYTCIKNIFYSDSIKNTPIIKASCIFICVKDDAIIEIADMLSDIKLYQNTMIVHTSGAYSSSIISDILKFPCASIHPILACSNVEFSREFLKNAFYTIEGDSKIYDRLKNIIYSIGANSMIISNENKNIYHAYMVLASNLLVSFIDIIHKKLEFIGIRLDLNILIELALVSLTQVRDMGLKKGITGPLARFDKKTIVKHLAILKAEENIIYRYLSKHLTERLYDTKKDEDKKEKMMNILSYTDQK